METRKKFNVKGMHCPSCEILIKDCLEETPGVKSAHASQKSNSAEVVFDSSKVNETKLRDIIKKCGYEVC